MGQVFALEQQQSAVVFEDYPISYFCSDGLNDLGYREFFRDSVLAVEAVLGYCQLEPAKVL